MEGNELIVEGLGQFEKKFSPYRESFVIIGGAACRAVLADGPVTPRKTVDIDMVLVLEKLDRSFISAFWSFIKAGGYKCAKRKDQDGNPKYVLYSFVGGQEDYPSQVELLSRPVDGLGNPEDHHIEIIDMVEDYSHLSAIILDTDYYNYLIEHSEVKGGLRYASADSLICLKVLAYLNLKKEKEAGNHVNDYDYKKHRRDVLMAAASLTVGETHAVAASLKSAITEFIGAVSDASVKKSLIASLGINEEAFGLYLEALEEAFVVE